MRMDGVREYNEGDAVELSYEGDRLVVAATYDGGHERTMVDLLDLLAWIRANRPELL